MFIAGGPRHAAAASLWIATRFKRCKRRNSAGGTVRSRLRVLGPAHRAIPSLTSLEAGGSPEGSSGRMSRSSSYEQTPERPPGSLSEAGTTYISRAKFAAAYRRTQFATSSRKVRQAASAARIYGEKTEQRFLPCSKPIVRKVDDAAFMHCIITNDSPARSWLSFPLSRSAWKGLKPGVSRTFFGAALLVQIYESPT